MSVPTRQHSDVELGLARSTTKVYDDGDLNVSNQSGCISGLCDCFLTIFAGLGELYSRCQSKRENQAFGCQTSGWPQWHQSECIMKTAFNRRGLDTAKATMWASFLKSCRVIRDAGEKWR